MKLFYLLALVATPALADEVWTTDGGSVVYEADHGRTAVLSFPYDGAVAQLYVEGLPGAMEERGVHTGYWIAADKGPCTAFLEGPDGLASNNWGVAEIIFDEAAFPTGFTALMGECTTPSSWEMRAESN